MYFRTVIAYFTAVPRAKLADQHILLINAWSLVSLICRRYGLSFAASDLWKLDNTARNNIASNENCAVSGEFMN